MKLNKILPITLLTGVLMLSACGSKKENSDSSGSNNESNVSNNSDSNESESTSTEPVYTVTETEFLSLKSKLSSPKIFIDGNFSFDTTVGGKKLPNKIAEGKFDGYIQGVRAAIDMKVDTYDSTDQTAAGSMYLYDEDNGWEKTGTKEIELSDVHTYVFGMLMFVPDAFDVYSYDADKRTYSATTKADNDELTCTFMVKDKEFLSIKLETEGETIADYSFYDYGTTTVTLPEVDA